MGVSVGALVWWKLRSSGSSVLSKHSGESPERSLLRVRVFDGSIDESSDGEL